MSGELLIEVFLFLFSSDSYWDDIKGREGELIGEILFLVVVCYGVYWVIKKVMSNRKKEEVPESHDK